MRRLIKSNLVCAAAVLAVGSRAFATPEHGVNLTYFGANVDPRVLDESLDNMTAMGVNHVSLDVWWFQQNINSTTVAPNTSLYTQTDASVRQVIDAMQSRGISVELRPLVDLSNDSAHWRGQIVAGDAWFNSPG